MVYWLIFVIMGAVSYTHLFINNLRNNGLSFHADAHGRVPTHCACGMEDVYKRQDNTVTTDNKEDKILVLESAGNLTLTDVLDEMKKEDTSHHGGHGGHRVLISCF